MTEQHAEYLAALHADPEVMAMIGGIRTDEQSTVWLGHNLDHWAKNGFGQWMLRDTTGQLIGRAGLRWIDPSVGERIVEVGYVLQRSAWGYGLATEATAAIVAIARDRYLLAELGAIVLKGNDRSTHVLKRCGFVFERWIAHPVGPHQFFHMTL